ncbi:hypothetical protein QEL91_004122 [Pseudomonas putida]|nr:hypothetical protein [Pseudomonas putida]
MRDFKTCIVACALAVSLSGCSAYKIWYGSDKPMMTYVIVKDGQVVAGLQESQQPPREIQGYIISWSPEYNAAFVSASGKGCIQPAMYAVTQSGDASIPAEIFTQGLAGSVSGNYKEALEKLISVTDQSTFLSIGMYGICQLAAADAITPEDTAALVQTLFEKAGKKESTPQPPAVVQAN